MTLLFLLCYDILDKVKGSMVNDGSLMRNHFLKDRIDRDNEKKKRGDLSVKESGEMYLESIYVLCKAGAGVRSVDVAEHMNYSKPSVCRAVGLLKKDGYIEVDRDGIITLTALGQERAENIFERHTVLTRMLMHLGVEEETAAEDACRMEHVISESSFHAMKKWLEAGEK